jgi:hypothetical protein
MPVYPGAQWVLSFPIPLRFLFASHSHLLSPVLQIIHRVISTFLIKQAGLKRTQADTGAVILVQRFGSAANLNIHLHSPWSWDSVTPSVNIPRKTPST